MLIDDMLFEQSWFSELSLRQRFLYIYLLTKCTKTGVFEVNLRKFTYDMNDGKPVTRDDIFGSFGNRVRPLGESKGIYVDYLAFNWVRGKPLDPYRNPLHKGLAQELAKYGLDFAKLNAMSNKKFSWVDSEGEVVDGNTAAGTDTYCYRGQQEVEEASPRINEKTPRKPVERFQPPSVDDVRAYCQERRNGIDAEAFVAFYESKGWMIGSNKMKSWRAAVITWEKGRKSNGTVNGNCVKQSANAISTGKSDIQNLF